jgi:hypothetical protein
LCEYNVLTDEMFVKSGDHRYMAHRQTRLSEIRHLMRSLKPALIAVRSQTDPWANTHMQAMLYRILLCVPFSVKALPANRTGLPSVVGLAALLFDTMVLPNNSLRDMCTKWVNWSARRLLKLSRIVRALRAHATPVVAGAVTASHMPGRR